MLVGARLFLFLLCFLIPTTEIIEMAEAAITISSASMLFGFLQLGIRAQLHQASSDNCFRVFDGV